MAVAQDQGAHRILPLPKILKQNHPRNMGGLRGEKWWFFKITKWMLSFSTEPNNFFTYQWILFLSIPVVSVPHVRDI